MPNGISYTIHHRGGGYQSDLFPAHRRAVKTTQLNLQ